MPLPLTFTEIDAFGRLKGLGLDGWEVDLLRALDDAKINPAEPEPPAQMSPKLFNAMFGGK